MLNTKRHIQSASGINDCYQSENKWS